MPNSGLSGGGLYTARLRAPLAAPDAVTASTGAPVSLRACASGLPMVADAQKIGSAPWKRATRARRRKRLATCEPNTPV